MPTGPTAESQLAVWAEGTRRGECFWPTSHCHKMAKSHAFLEFGPEGPPGRKVVARLARSQNAFLVFSFLLFFFHARYS